MEFLLLVEQKMNVEDRMLKTEVVAQLFASSLQLCEEDRCRVKW